MARHGETMRTLRTKNDHFLVAGGKTSGVPRWAYFLANGKFLRYASKREWDEACEHWGESMKKVREDVFIFPALGSWRPQSVKKTKAGKLGFFWRWRDGHNRCVQQTSVMLDGTKILEKDDSGVELSLDVIKKINLVYAWRNEGFNFFDYGDAVNSGLHGGGWLMPTALINFCSITSYDEKAVKRAVDFIGVERPDKYRLKYLCRENQEEPWAIEISYSMNCGGGSYWLYLDGSKADDFDGNLECLSHAGTPEIYKGLLWVFLNPLKEELSKKKIEATI